MYANFAGNNLLQNLNFTVELNDPKQANRKPLHIGL